MILVGLACRLQQVTGASDRHRPSSRMLLLVVSTFTQSRAFAPAARRQRAVTSDGRKPRLVGQRKRTPSWRAGVISVGLLDLLPFTV
eukprot:scaffold23_cov281-Chaetoceros_neogracile.AAC.3